MKAAEDGSGGFFLSIRNGGARFCEISVIYRDDLGRSAVKKSSFSLAVDSLKDFSKNENFLVKGEKKEEVLSFGIKGDSFWIKKEKDFHKIFDDWIFSTSFKGEKSSFLGASKSVSYTHLTLPTILLV